jgi:hypothetical protein
VIQKIIVIGVMVLSMDVSAFALTTLMPGSATVTASTVSFPVILANTSGTAISGITADIVFNPDELALIMDGTNTISATAGAAATASGKQLSQSSPSAGVLHIVVIDLAGNTSIPDGTIAQLSFSILTAAASGNYTFTTIPTATDSQGGTPAIVGGSINVSNPLPAVNGTCGTADGQYFTIKPTTNYCLTGTASAIIGTGPWSWSCAGSNGGANASCTANLSVPTPVNGTCGTASGQVFSIKPATNLCTIGAVSAITGTGPWSWSCAGSNGGTNASCTANLPGPTPVNGTCGTANGQVFSIKPVANLCTIGAASAITGVGPWSWSCDGSNGGTNAGCTANLPASIPAFIAGDLKNDGVVDLSDAFWVLQAVVGAHKLSADQYKRADMNADGIVNVADAILIIAKVVGL